MQQASGSAGGLGSTCSTSSISTSGSLHGGIAGGNSHTMASQQSTSGSQNQVHTQQQSTIRHKVCIIYSFLLFDRRHVGMRAQKYKLNMPIVRLDNRKKFINKRLSHYRCILVM